MRNEILERFYNLSISKKLNLNDFLVFFCIFLEENENISNKMISLKTNISIDNIKKSIKKLIKNKILISFTYKRKRILKSYIEAIKISKKELSYYINCKNSLKEKINTTTYSLHNQFLFLPDYQQKNIINVSKDKGSILANKFQKLLKKNGKISFIVNTEQWRKHFNSMLKKVNYVFLKNLIKIHVENINKKYWPQIFDPMTLKLKFNKLLDAIQRYDISIEDKKVKVKFIINKDGTISSRSFH